MKPWYRNNAKNFCFCSLLAFVLALIFVRPDKSNCLSNPAPVNPEAARSLSVAYLNAVIDASNVSAGRISTRLVQITLSNTNLAWRTNSGVRQVKVVSLVTSNAAGQYYKKGTNLLITNTQWVTAFPELKNFCASVTNGDKVLRMKQALGLSPVVPYDTVVEYWISPDYLCRPTPDPAINTSTAGLSDSSNAPLIAWNARVPAYWVDWYNSNYLSCDFGLKSANPVGGASPLTQLGYTYDWGSSASNHEGLSEFVIPSGTLLMARGAPVSIDVENVIPAFRY